MRLSYLLALLLTLPASGQAQAPPTAVDSMLARIGSTIDPSEKAYFGLFPEITLSSFVDATLEPLPSGEMQVVIRVPGRTDERRLDAETTTFLARYVVYYEALRAPNVTPDLARVDRNVRLSGLGRHAYDRSSEKPMEVGTRDGQTIRGWLLFADYERLILR